MKRIRVLLREALERLPTVKFIPKKDIDLNYMFSGTLNVERCTTGTEYFGSTFGQDIEPKGYYCTQRENTMFDDNPDYEFKEITIRKPIVIDITPDDKKIGWKKDLSEMFGGLTGKRLSNKLKKEGYDSIITTDKNGATWEIVIL